MTTLIVVSNSEGVVGKCDALCYLATHDDCTCICGGKNHGVGLEQAIKNTKEMAEEVDAHLEEFAEARGHDAGDLWVSTTLSSSFSPKGFFSK